MGTRAWIAIGIALGARWGALYRTALYMVAGAGGLLGGLIGTAVGSAWVTTFVALAPWLTAALGALALIGVHQVATGTSRAGRHEPEGQRWTT